MRSILFILIFISLLGISFVVSIMVLANGALIILSLTSNILGVPLSSYNLDVTLFLSQTNNSFLYLLQIILMTLIGILIIPMIILGSLTLPSVFVESWTKNPKFKHVVFKTWKVILIIFTVVVILSIVAGVVVRLFSGSS